ncbi:MAG: hypothetical protein ABWY58_13315 [Aeromicrobium sp.]
MEPGTGPVVLESADRHGSVVAVVEATRPSDAVVRRAIEEAASRTGEMVVLQLVDDPSVLRRAVAQARLARDVAWWSRDLSGIAASVEVVEESSVDGAVADVRDASCVVIDPATMARDAARVLTAEWAPPDDGLPGTRDLPQQAPDAHPWPKVVVVPADHSR